MLLQPTYEKHVQLSRSERQILVITKIVSANLMYSAKIVPLGDLAPYGIHNLSILKFMKFIMKMEIQILKGPQLM